MALYELSDDDVNAIERASRFLRASVPSEDPMLLRRLEKLEPAKPVVGIHVEGGLVQAVRSSIQVDVVIADTDNIDNCAKLRDTNGNPITCACDTAEVPEQDREDHAATIERFQQYLALPLDVTFSQEPPVQA
jgi:hypothetical protein